MKPKFVVPAGETRSRTVDELNKLDWFAEPGGTLVITESCCYRGSLIVRFGECREINSSDIPECGFDELIVEEGGLLIINHVNGIVTLKSKVWDIQGTIRLKGI